MGQWLRDVAQGWADLVLPTACPGCSLAATPLCPACRTALEQPAFETRPDPAPAGLPHVYATAPYADTVRNLLVAHKERGARACTAPLGAALARAVRAAAVTGRVGLVPVPSARRAVRERGRDVTAELARHAAAQLRRDGLDARVLPVLRHTRTVADQSGLDTARRSANLHRALGVPRRLAPLLPGIRLVIVDDLLTTGSTVAEAARAVTAGGGRVDAAAVVAATQRRHPRGLTGSGPAGRRQVP